MKARVLGVIALILSVLYIGLALNLISKSHPARLIYASIYGNWEYGSSLLLPFPFREKFTKQELLNRVSKEVDDWPNFELIPYSILVFKDEDKFSTSVHQEKLDSLTDALLDSGMDIDKVANPGCTSLQMAILEENSHAIEFLVSRNASLLESHKNTGEDVCALSISALRDRVLEKGKKWKVNK